jgi:PAS domain S-box-containing protein
MPKKRLEDCELLRTAARGETVRPGPSAPGEDLSAILDALPAMVGYWDADLRNRFANRAYVEFFGLTPDAIRGRHAHEVLGPELYALNRPHIERALAGERQLFERTIIDPSGASRHTQASYIPDIFHGKVRGLIALVTDITARQAAEQAHAAAETRFRLAFTHSPVGMGMMDSTGRLLQVNPALCKMLGYRETELRGRTFADLVSPERQQEQRDRTARMFGGEPEPSSAESQFLRSDGSPIWVILSLAPADGEVVGETLAIGHVQDISTRKQAEDELRHSRERLAEAEQVAQMGSWEWDITNDETTWSDGLFHIYGLTPDEFDPSLRGFEQSVYPDDRELVSRTIEQALAERSSFTLEYRAIRPDGRVHTLRSRGEVVVDNSGKPTRLIGIARDITDAKLAQEALQSTSADLERRATELQQLALRTAAEPHATPRAPLTPRQLEIVRLIAQGLTNAAIAERLVVTEGTVKWHVKQILAKTASSNRAEAVARVLGAPEQSLNPKPPPRNQTSSTPHLSRHA